MLVLFFPSVRAKFPLDAYSRLVGYFPNTSLSRSPEREIPMVEEGSRGIKRISLEDVLDAVRTNKNTRAAVIRNLVQQFTDELVRHLQIVAKQPGKPNKK